MGTRRRGDGSNWQPEGDRPREEPAAVSGLPPEWGRIVIPDDASALSAEAEQVRGELTNRRFSVDPPRRPTERRHTVGVSLLIMSVAVLITLVSLFAMAWSGSSLPQPPAPEPEPMPAITLQEVGGPPVALHTVGPAVILLVEECDCADLINDTRETAPPHVTVVVVDQAPPSQAPPAGVRWLLDPDGAVRATLGLSPPTGVAATVLLVDQEQALTFTTRAVSVRSFQPALSTL